MLSVPHSQKNKAFSLINYYFAPRFDILHSCRFQRCNIFSMFLQTEQQIRETLLSFFQERAGDLEELVTAEFSRLREFLLEEEERIKGKLQKQKEEKLNQLEEALTEATEQISQLESTADQLRLKLTEEENPEQLKVKEEGGGAC